MLQWSTIVAWMTRRRVNVVGLLEHGEVMGGEGGETISLGECEVTVTTVERGLLLLPPFLRTEH